MTAVSLLLSKIPDASQIKAFISENDADEKMLDEWLWKTIFKGNDYKAMERQQIEEAYIDGSAATFGFYKDTATKNEASEYFTQKYQQ